MYKKLSYFILFFITIFAINLSIGERSEVSYVTTQEDDLPIFDSHNATIGFLKINQTYKVKSEEQNYWKIRFGNGVGYVAKNHTSTTSKTEKTPKEYKSKNTIIVNENTIVYEKASPKAKQMAIINKNQRYPIVSNHYFNWYKVRVGDKVGYIRKDHTEKDNGIPVLMYHHLLADAENKKFRDVSAVTSVENFEAQMKWLYDNDYQSISLQELEQFLNKEINLPGKAVVITFDDGLKSNYIYGYPILKQYHFKATEFLITSRIHLDTTPDFKPDAIQTLSMAEVEAMQDVFDMQSHTHNLHSAENGKSHVVIKDEDEVKNDFLMSNNMIQSKYMAYPFGQYNRKTIEILKELDMKMAFTIKNGKVKIGDNPYKLKRLAVNYDHTLEEFVEMVEN
ncbi:polysaccharide deacetylase family protein [Metasolibacillus meyeri]|uniref:Polysaccharide deacetylase family protein n=1 Tax=Metasolibacillus meyeri TaxID=1071052 RepID=A0AAW9NJL7_9BACL|nr:polysaccharide deacetylase family protein [Metasolibacillus meyeri]MEC1177600.1 polysaccharide deacetylase family protein [Metasolibacillus meyeri]